MVYYKKEQGFFKLFQPGDNGSTLSVEYLFDGKQKCYLQVESNNPGKILLTIEEAKALSEELNKICEFATVMKENPTE